MSAKQSNPGSGKRAAELGPVELSFLYVAFAAIASFVYWPAMDGAFVSDDYLFIVTNTYVHELSWANFLDILNPWGGPALDTANYAPVHLLALAVEIALFGDRTFGFHLVNVLLHALCSLLLTLSLRRHAGAHAAAIFGGALFLLHPANVEAVAWIFQLKTILALLFSMWALLLLWRRPLAATGLFALALLSKTSAFYAIPVAAYLAWSDAEARGAQARWRWIGVWVALFLLYAVPQFFTFERTGEFGMGIGGGGWVAVRTIAAIGARYLVMAATSLGVSAFQDPEPARSWLDPWWLGALAIGALLTWRVVVTFRRRSPEAAFWVWAVASWAPICQIFPFLYPMADRYLYFILPGLIGGVTAAGVDAWPRLRSWLQARGVRAPEDRPIARVGLAVALALCLVFGQLSTGRARIWESELTLLMDAASHYPNGLQASLLAARKAARQGDVDGTVAALRRAMLRGFDRFQVLLMDPVLNTVREAPAFEALLHDVAGVWLEGSLAKAGSATAADLRNRGQAHLVRGEYRQAIRNYETALRLGSAEEKAIRIELARARLKLRIEERD